MFDAGFNISLEPGFSVSRLCWMLAYGGVYAVANLRCVWHSPWVSFAPVPHSSVRECVEGQQLFCDSACEGVYFLHFTR